MSWVMVQGALRYVGDFSLRPDAAGRRELADWTATAPPVDADVAKPRLGVTLSEAVETHEMIALMHRLVHRRLLFDDDEPL